MSLDITTQLRDIILADTGLNELINELYPSQSLTAFIGYKTTINIDDCPALFFVPVNDKYKLKISKQRYSNSDLSIFIAICNEEIDSDNVFDGERNKMLIAEEIMKILNRQPINEININSVNLYYDIPRSHPIYQAEINLNYSSVEQ